MQAMLEQSLEVVAESMGDITPSVYAKYFERCPESKELMSHIDDIVRGRMLEEVLRLLLVDSYDDEQKYLEFELKNHKLAYRVQPHMYENLLSALFDTMEEGSGSEWTDAHAQAWQQRINELLEQISSKL